MSGTVRNCFTYNFYMIVIRSESYGYINGNSNYSKTEVSYDVDTMSLLLYNSVSWKT